MGFLSTFRNALSSSKFKPKLNPLFSRVASSPPPPIPTSTLAGDLKPKSCKLMFLVENRNSDTTTYSVICEKNLWRSDFPHRPFPESGSHAITGSCNGLYLVLGNVDGPGLSLWNPNTNELKTLPRSPVWCPRYALDNTPDRYGFGDCDSYGFGFDSASNDYKALRILEYGYKLYLVELYSLNSNSWKQIAYPYPECTQIDSSVHINGVCYWFTRGSSPTHDFILSFDFANEEFSSPANHIPLPPEDQGIEGSYRKLVEFNGSLAIVEQGGRETRGEPFIFMVWVWNGKSWSIGLPRITIDHVSLVVGVFQRHKLFLQGDGFDGDLLLFDCDEKRVLENLGGFRTGVLCVYPYVESYISLNGK